MTTYADWVTAISNQIVVDADNAAFLEILPTAINYAEARIYRELDMLVANVRDASSSTVASSRNFNLPTSVGTFLIVDGLNVITPASTSADSGTRTPLIPVSRDFLDLSWPSSTGSDVPQYFAYISQDTYSSSAQTQVILGPWPDAEYRIEVVGKVQPAALTSTNTETYLTANLFDLFFAATMVFMTSWQQNTGSGSDNPAMALDWKGKYAELQQSAATWEARKRFGGASWSSKPVEPTAVPQRG